MKNMHLLSALVVLIAVAPAVQAKTKSHKLNTDEERLFEIVKNHPDQGRPRMKLDPILCKVARARAKDMAKRRYFSHVNPSGQGPNFLVTKAGFFLPDFYDQSETGNNIESIAAKSPRSDADTGFQIWLDSPPHKRHLLAETQFNREQKYIGVGIFQATSAPFETYYVFLSAPKNRNPRPPKLILKGSDGKVISVTRKRAEAPSVAD